MSRFEEAKKEFEAKLKLLKDWELKDLLTSKVVLSNPISISCILYEQSRRGIL